MEARNHKLYSRTSDDCFARVEGLCLRVLRETERYGGRNLSNALNCSLKC